MLLDELKLILSGWRMEQAFDVAQMPNAVSGSQLAGGFHVGRGMFRCQLQKSLQYANALRPTVFNHQFGPGAGLRADQPGTVQ